MRITIVPSEDKVYVGEYSFGDLDLSACGIPSNVAAFQWDGLTGEIEYQSVAGTKPVNDKVSSLPEWVSACLPVWEAKAAAAGVIPVTPTEKPPVGPTQVLIEASPVFESGEWRQVWVVREATPEEIKARTPQSVTPRQARLALFGAGLLAQVETAIAGMEEPTKTIATINWEYATQIVRADEWVANLGGALGMTDEQLDDLFKVAATL